MATKIKNIAEKNALLLIFIIMCVVLTIMTDSFLTVSNITDVVRTNSISGLLEVGLTYVILSGGIDLSVESTAALAGLLAGYLSTQPIVAILVGLVIGVAVGTFNGCVLEKTGVQPFIFTLAMNRVVRGIVLVITKGANYYTLDPKFTAIVKANIFGIPSLVIVFVIIIAITYFILNKTKHGRYIYATGSNEDAARLSGIHTHRIKITSYIICGALASLAGVLLTSRLAGAETSAAEGWSLDAIACVIIGGTSMKGGRGGILNTLLGIFIIAVLNNGMILIGVPTNFNQFVKGLVLLAAVLLDVSSRKRK